MSLNVKHIGVDENFMPAMEMEMKEGRMFRGGKADSTSYILNEEAVKIIGMKDPVGKRFKLLDVDGTIIGVVKNFHIGSMHDKKNTSRDHALQARHLEVVGENHGPEYTRGYRSH